MKTSHLLTLIVVISIGIIGGVVWSQSNAGPGEYDEFAQCLTDSGTTMYGSYRCPFCTDQKEDFGNSWKHVNYVECDLGTAGQAQLCVDQQIQAYPTWIFGDGERITGRQTLAALSDRSGCMLDGEEPTSPAATQGEQPETTAPVVIEETPDMEATVEEEDSASEETEETVE